MRSYRLMRLGLLIFSILFAAGLVSTPAALGQPAAAQASEERRTLIRNAELVLTMDPSLGTGRLGLLEKADVLIENDRIVAVGQNLDATDAQVIDASGKIVMPGFVDTHNHLWQSLIRACGINEDLIVWLNDCIFPFVTKPIAYEDAYAGVRLSTLDLIQTGVTTTADWSHAYSSDFVRGNLQALSDSGMRFVYIYNGAVGREEQIRQHKRELIDPNPRASLQLASHPIEFLRGDMEAMVKLARELGVGFNVHLLENIAQREEQPIELLQEVGAFDAGAPTLFANHAVHLTDAEIAYLAGHDVRIAHNPLSNLRLASGFMRTPEMLEADLKIGLGLDGGTNDTSDMFNNMRIAIGIQRGQHLTAKVRPTIEDALVMSTIGGAEMLGMHDQIGSLTPGKQADLIVINPGMINFAPRFDWVSQIVFNGQPVNVEWVFVDGRPLKARGRLVGVNEKKVIQATEDAVFRIKELIGK